MKIPQISQKLKLPTSTQWPIVTWTAIIIVKITVITYLWTQFDPVSTNRRTWFIMSTCTCISSLDWASTRTSIVISRPPIVTIISDRIQKRVSAWGKTYRNCRRSYWASIPGLNLAGDTASVLSDWRYLPIFTCFCPVHDRVSTHREHDARLINSRTTISRGDNAGVSAAICGS